MGLESAERGEGGGVTEKGERAHTKVSGKRYGDERRKEQEWGREAGDDQGLASRGSLDAYCVS